MAINAPVRTYDTVSRQKAAQQLGPNARGSEIQKTAQDIYADRPYDIASREEATKALGPNARGIDLQRKAQDIYASKKASTVVTSNKAADDFNDKSQQVNDMLNQQNQQSTLQNQQQSTSEQEKNVQNEYDADIKKYNEDIATINKGGTPEEEAAVQAIKDAYAPIIEAQTQANKNQESGAEILGIRSGRSRYAPEIQAGIMQETINKGKQALAQLSTKMNDEITKAKQAIKDKNIEALNSSFDRIQKLKDNKRQALKDLQDSAIKQAQEYRAGIEFKQKQETIVLPGIASGLVNVDDAGNIIQPTAEDIQTVAAQLGVNPNMLLGEVNKRIDTLKKTSAEERKNQLEIEKMKHEILMSGLSADQKEFDAAKARGDIPKDMDFFTFLAKKEGSKATMPTSQREWILAGGESGTGETYAEWVAKDKGLDSKITTQVDKLASSFDSNPIVKDFVVVQNKKRSVDNIINAGIGGPGDLAIVYEFMKALDPNSVVRETEYATAAKSGNIFIGAYTKFNGYFKEEGGFLPENVKNDFKKIIDVKYKASEQDYDNLYNEVARKINRKTGDDDGADYLTQYKNQQKAPSLQQAWEDFKPSSEQQVQYEKMLNDRVPKNEILDWFNISYDNSFNGVGGDTDKASGKIESGIVNGKKISADATFLRKLEQADAEMKAAGLDGLKIGEHYRSAERQREIRKKFGYTSDDQPSGDKGLPKAAPPGTSFHEKGLAVDVTNWEEAQPYLAKYGIINGIPGDMGHFSLGEIKQPRLLAKK